MSIARTNPEQKVVFFAAGFETTMAPVAAMVIKLRKKFFSKLLI